MMRRFVKSVCASRLGSLPRRIRGAVLAALAGGAALAALSGEAAAQEIQLTGPLAGAPAVRQLRLHRAGRFEISVGSSFTLLDQYERTILPGGTLSFHFTDWIGIGVWGGYGLQVPTFLTDQLQEKAIDSRHCAISPTTKACKLTAVNLTRGNIAKDQLGHINWAVAPQLQVVPFRGKIALFSALFVDTDVNIFAGPAFVGLQERKPCGLDEEGKAVAGGLPCADAKSFALQSRIAIAPTFGLGLNFYPASFFGIGFEFRALPFAWNTSGFDNHGGGNNDQFPDNSVNSADREFFFNSMLSVRLAFQFPISIKKTD
jgi:hypothetical protein